MINNPEVEAEVEVEVKAEVEAIIRIALMVAKIDGRISGEETMRLQSEMRESYPDLEAALIDSFITQAELEYQSRSLRADDAISEIKPLVQDISPPMRPEAFEIAKIMVWADGEINSKELPFLIRLQPLLR